MRKVKSYKYFLQYQMPIHIIMLITSLFPDSTPILKVRGKLLSPFFKKTGANFQVCRGVTITNTHNITIGDNVFIGFNSWINGVGLVEIQDEVMIGPFVSMSTSTHQFKDNSVRFGGYLFEKIVIEKGSWIAAHSVITAGCRVSKGTLVAAGSVVNKTFPDYSIIGGVPAKYIKDVTNNPTAISDRWGE